MAKSLRKYQEVACDWIDKRLENYKRPFIYVLSCGTGKSLVISELAKRHGKVLVLTLSAELCKQDLEEMWDYGVEAVAYSASLNKKETGSITVATIGSAYKNPTIFSYVDIVIIDEAQSVNCADPNSMFMRLLIEINKMKKQDGERVKVLGLTATAYRNVQKVANKGRYYETTTLVQPLNRIPCRGGFLWSTIEEGITTKQALEQGYLTPVEYYCSPSGGRLVVNSTGADYTEDSLDEWGDGVVERCAEVMKGAEKEWNIRSGIVAVPFIRHAEALQALCEHEGMSTTVVSSKTPPRARKERIEAFKNGEIRWLVQVNTCNVGFNAPLVDCLVWARPTLSLNLYCLSEDTEILTSDGWKSYKDIHIGDAIPNLNMRTGRGEWDSIKAKIYRPLDDDEYWVEYDSPYSKFKVTNKHRMIARRTVGEGRKTEWGIYDAEELLDRQPWQVPTAVEVDQPGVPLSDDDLWIIGMLMTDGSFAKKNGKITGHIRLFQSDKYPYVISEIEKRLTNVGLRWEKRLSIEKGTAKNFIQGKQVVARHNHYVFSLHSDTAKRYEVFLSKDLSPALMAMNKHQLLCLLSGMWAGDGVKKASVDYIPRTTEIVTVRKEVAEKLQSLCAINGLHAYTRTENNGRNKPVWYISIKDQAWKSIGTPLCKGSNRPRVEKNITDKGNCWCVETEKNGTIITRYKGKVIVMGNCQSVGRVMRLAEGKKVARVLDLVGTTEMFGHVEDVHLGKEGYKTTIEGSKGKISGVPLRTFHWTAPRNGAV